jgi:hypothetical protein
MGIGLTSISGLQFPGEPDRLAGMLVLDSGLSRVVAAVLLIGPLGGCVVDMNWWYDCANPDLNHRDIFGNLDPCHENLSTPSLECDGKCVPVSPPGWSETVLLWHGAPADVPSCPTWAPAHSSEGNADLTSSPAACVACECQHPTGTCALPTTITASNAPVCTTPGNISLSFDPPAGWAGDCTQANAIPAGQLCGGVPCVQSVSIGALILNETGCTPTVPSAPTPPPGPGDSSEWGTVAIACSSNHGGQCSDPGETCAPNLPPPPPGFQVCISAFEDHECFEPFPNKYVTYFSTHDARACSPCTCDTPSGGMCTGAISIFNDSACSTLPLVTLTVGSDGPQCTQVLPGYALASKKSASPLTYTAGACKPSGGEPIGTEEPTQAKTFCCQP